MRKFTGFYSQFLLVTGILLSGFSSFSQVNMCSQVDKVIARMQNVHYNPVAFDGDVKKQIVAMYVDVIDAKNTFFSKQDLERLQAKAATDGLCQAYAESVELYYKRVAQYDSLVKVFLGKPVKFMKGDALVINPSTSSHLRKSSTELNAYREKKIRQKLLDLLYDKIIGDSLVFKTEKDLTPAMEKELREKLALREKIYIERLVENKMLAEERLRAHFLNAIAHRYDPHSDYFPADEKKEFEEHLSKEKKSFGIELSENSDYEIEITGILPGSPAWISNEVDEEDIIESITDKKGVKHELAYKGMEYVSKILKDENNNEITFHLRTKANEKTDVTLIKAVVENVENAFTGYTISDDKTKIGYIPLPSFYTDSETDEGLGCANDVAKEILLLKKDGIQGLVLDLRNNGGGSLKEAIEICGLFIDEGPMAIYKSRTEKPYLMKDMNRGTVYDGPLIILVNSMSASASEVVSGCLQDYNRALIVGDVTYGKGTAQSVFPVDSVLSVNSAQNGYLKITIGKFYHVSRKSNQEKGIIPEIRVPDIYSSIDFFKEAKTLYHLRNDSTSKKVTYVKSTSGINDAVKEKSKARIAGSAEFKRVQELADSLKILAQNDLTVPLEILPFIAYMKKQDDFMQRIDDAYTRKQEGIKIGNHAFAKTLLEVNEEEKEFNQAVIDELMLDPVIAEAFWISRDFINFGK